MIACVGRYPGAREEAELASRARSGDPSAREELIVRNLRLARKASAYFGRYAPGLDEEQRFSCCTLGLVRAVDLFDPERGARLSTFAFIHMRAALQEGQRIEGSTIKLPKEFWSGEMRIGDRKRWKACRKCIGFYRPRAWGDRDKEDVLASLPDRTPDDRGFEGLGETAAAAVREIPKSWAEVVTRYFGLDGMPEQSLPEIARSRGYTKQRASKILGMAIERMRENLRGAEVVA